MNISVIIPVHELNDETSVLLSNAIESINKQEKIKTIPEILIVHTPGIKDKLNKLSLKSDNIKMIENDNKSDFQTQINLGVKNVKTKYFSILELDDEYSTTYFYNGEKYIKTFNDVDIFLSIIIEVNNKNEGIKLTNELVWSQQFVGENGEMGYLNLKSIKQNTDFKISGAIINKDEFLNLGGLKSNIKLTFNYEFLLRALNNACKVYTIPKIGYKHRVMRTNSLFDVYSKTMSVKERKFWFETATNESNFTKDRVIDTSNLEKK